MDYLGEQRVGRLARNQSSDVQIHKPDHRMR
jgi:hypothetical protein